MDIQMPEMDGMEATKAIRKWETHNLQLGTPQAPHHRHDRPAMKGDREICLEAGMDDYIAKPIKRELVFEMLDKWVSRGNDSQKEPLPTVYYFSSLPWSPARERFPSSGCTPLNAGYSEKWRGSRPPRM